MRREPAQAFARAEVNGEDNRAKEIGRNSMEITALWKEETKDVIGIFVSTALPGLVRFGKENRDMKNIFKGAKLSKL